MGINASTNGDSAIGRRLKRIRSDKSLNQKDFSAYIGLSVRGYQNYERGVRTISKELICALIMRYNIDPVWLLTERGTMYRRDDKIREIRAGVNERSPSDYGSSDIDTRILFRKRQIEIGHDVGNAVEKQNLMLSAQRINGVIDFAFIYDLDEIGIQRLVALFWDGNLTRGVDDES